jgi:hypothetical protein
MYFNTNSIIYQFTNLIKSIHINNYYYFNINNMNVFFLMGDDFLKSRAHLSGIKTVSSTNLVAHLSSNHWTTKWLNSLTGGPGSCETLDCQSSVNM